MATIASCNCHRNFHRKESPTAKGSPIYPAAPVAYDATRTPAGYFHHHQPLYMAAAAAGHTPRPLVQPSTSHSGRDGPMSALGPLSGVKSLGGTGPSGKKRFCSKFTQEQKDKMLAFLERVGWRIQKHDEAVVKQFGDEVGVRCHVIKVWMHNNKHKKP